MNKVLFIGHQWPEPASSAAGWRMTSLIHFFLDQGNEVHFASATVKGEYAEVPDPVIEHSIFMNDSSFDDWVQQLDPSMVIFDRFMVEEQYGWRVADHCPNAIRILDSEDLHCLRAARKVAYELNRSLHASDLDSDISKREIASIYRCDLTLIISSFEMELLQTHFQIPSSLIHYLPFFSKGQNSAQKSFEERQHFISIGNFLHAPNREAVKQLKQEIWPLIRSSLPEAELHVYGAYVNDHYRQMHNEKEGFLVKDRAESSAEVISNARLLLAPLPFGAGLKGKLLEAMECRTPSVTTNIGAEGMHADIPWPGCIEDDLNAFAQVAVNLYTDPEAWQIAQTQCKVVLDTGFNSNEYTTTLKDRLFMLKANLAIERQQNFVGAMLQHHTARSTEFMSRWIELKNASK